jgi:hypothetical protein
MTHLPVLLLSLSLLACTGGTNGTAPTTDTDTTSGYQTDPSDRCAFIAETVSAAGFDTTVRCDAEVATFVTNSTPDHTVMTGIVRTNLQIPVPSVDYEIPIPLEPALATDVTTIDNAIAVAINGIPIYDYSSQGELDPAEYDPSVDTSVNGELDVCGGHAGRGDDYHYHVAPSCMLDAMANPGDATVIGWAFDGYPLYGDRNPDGSTIAADTLDICNGQADATFGHRYHTSSAAPYIVQCLVGEVDLDRYSPVPPLDAGNGARPLGRLPQGGDPVEDLTHTSTSDGGAEMTFSQEDVDMRIAYAPATGQDGCYDFTIETADAPITGTYCR